MERTDSIERLAALIRSTGFDAAHAIMARPLGDGYQILSGHNRVKAATQAELATVWTWVRTLTDAPGIGIDAADAPSLLAALRHPDNYGIEAALAEFDRYRAEAEMRDSEPAGGCGSSYRALTT